MKTTTKTTEKTAAKIMAELEAEIDQLEARVTNAADTQHDARQQVEQLQADWLAAAAAIDKDIGARTKATAIRKVIDHVTLTFAPTGRHRPKHYVAGVEIIPSGGVTGEVSNAGSAGRRPTANSGATRDCGCGTCRSRSARRSGTGGCT